MVDEPLGLRAEIGLARLSGRLLLLMPTPQAGGPFLLEPGHQFHTAHGLLITYQAENTVAVHDPEAARGAESLRKAHDSILRGDIDRLRAALEPWESSIVDVVGEDEQTSVLGTAAALLTWIHEQTDPEKGRDLGHLFERLAAPPNAETVRERVAQRLPMVVYGVHYEAVPPDRREDRGGLIVEVHDAADDGTRAEQPAGEGLIPDALFRLLLDLHMADDHAFHAGSVLGLQQQLEHYLDEEAAARGYDGWVEAFHQYMRQGAFAYPLLPGGGRALCNQQAPRPYPTTVVCQRELDHPPDHAADFYSEDAGRVVRAVWADGPTQPVPGVYRPDQPGARVNQLGPPGSIIETLRAERNRLVEDRDRLGREVADLRPRFEQAVREQAEARAETRHANDLMVAVTRQAEQRGRELDVLREKQAELIALVADHHHPWQTECRWCEKAGLPFDGPDRPTEPVDAALRALAGIADAVVRRFPGLAPDDEARP